MPPVLTLEVGELRFVVCLSKNERKKNNYRIYDFFNIDLAVFYENFSGETLMTSPYYNLKANEIINIDNIRFDKLLSSFKRVEYNEETMNRANFLMLELIKAYDLDNKRKEIINTAKEFSDWIMKNSKEEELPYSIRIINHLQIEKRLRKLKPTDFKDLFKITDNPDTPDEILVAVYLLLDEQLKADEYFSRLDKNKQDEFKNYPIYYFWDRV